MERTSLLSVRAVSSALSVGCCFSVAAWLSPSVAAPDEGLGRSRVARAPSVRYPSVDAVWEQRGWPGWARLLTRGARWAHTPPIHASGPRCPHRRQEEDGTDN